MQRHALPIAAVLLAGLILPVSAQGSPPPMGEAEITTGSIVMTDDAMTDVDPALLAQCRSDAVRRRLSSDARARFVAACVTPED